jgi:hypothetical protein
MHPFGFQTAAPWSRCIIIFERDEFEEEIVGRLWNVSRTYIPLAAQRSQNMGRLELDFDASQDSYIGCRCILKQCQRTLMVEFNGNFGKDMET